MNDVKNGVGLDPLDGIKQADTLRGVLLIGAVEILAIATKVAAEPEPVGCKLVANPTINSVG